MTVEYPKDVDGEVLKFIADDGNDMSKPMDVDFHVAAPTEQAAEMIADAAEEIGYETFVDFDDGQDDEPEEEELTEPWTCTCQKTMVLDYKSVMAAQAELDALAKPAGGYADGWGTMGNAEPAADENS